MTRDARGRFVKQAEKPPAPEKPYIVAAYSKTSRDILAVNKRRKRLISYTESTRKRFSTAEQAEDYRARLGPHERWDFRVMNQSIEPEPSQS